MASLSPKWDDMVSSRTDASSSDLRSEADVISDSKLALGVFYNAQVDAKGCEQRGDDFGITSKLGLPRDSWRCVNTGNSFRQRPGVFRRLIFACTVDLDSGCLFSSLGVAVGEVGVDWGLAQVRRSRLRRAQGCVRENEGNSSRRMSPQKRKRMHGSAEQKSLYFGDLAIPCGRLSYKQLW